MHIQVRAGTDPLRVENMVHLLGERERRRAVSTATTMSIVIAVHLREAGKMIESRVVMIEDIVDSMAARLHHPDRTGAMPGTSVDITATVAKDPEALLEI